MIPFFRFMLIFLNMTIASHLISNQAKAGIHLAVDGSSSNNDMGLQNNKRSMIRGSVSFDVGSHLRVGITHRLDTMVSSGYRQSSSTLNYYFEKNQTDVASNSLDLTLILFYGDLFVPYVQAGAIVKDYYVKEQSGGITYILDPGKSPTQPSAGAGLNIVLTKQFNLKLSYDVSPGYKISSPNEQNNIQMVLDTTTSMGLVYQL